MSEDRTTLELDAKTVQFLSRLAETWGVSVNEAVCRAVEQAYVIGPASPLSEREVLLLKYYLQGSSAKEIAEELGEDVKTIRYDLNMLRSKVWYRVKRAKSGETPVTPPSRLEAFKQLQRRLKLTSAKAAEWQNAIREARR